MRGEDKSGQTVPEDNENGRWGQRGFRPVPPKQWPWQEAAATSPRNLLETSSLTHHGPTEPEAKGRFISCASPAFWVH